MNLASFSGMVSLAIAWSAPFAVRADDRPATPPPRPGAIAKVAAAPSADPPPVDIRQAVIRKAIADSKDPLDDLVPAGRGSFGSGGATAQQRIDRRFREAEIPSCLTTDAFRFDPPTLGPIGFAGFLALPFWMHAIATGKCRN